MATWGQEEAIPFLSRVTDWNPTQHHESCLLRLWNRNFRVVDLRGLFRPEGRRIPERHGGERVLPLAKEAEEFARFLGL